MKKILTLCAAVLASFSLWAAETVNTGTYSTQTISEDFTTSTWAFAKPSSSVNIPIGTKENDIIYDASSAGKVKVGSNNLSWQGSSSVYIYVPAGSAGTISWTPSSTSESRYAQLYVNGEAAGEKRLYSRDSGTGEITSDGKKGPQSLAFTAADLTTRNDSTFLHFKDNNTELKIASIKVVLTTGDYANCTNPEAHLAFNKSTAFVGEQFTYDYGSLNGGALNTSYTLDGVTAVENTDYTFTSGNLTVLKAGQFVMHRTVDAENGYCAVDVSDTILINEANPVTAVTIDGPTEGYVGYELTYTATAEGATAYQWLVDGVDANTNAATFKYTAVKGSHSIVCSARNKFNAENDWIASDPIALTVTSLYGQLIAADAETGSGNIDKDITATGIVGGTVHQKTQKNAKLGGEGHYFSLTLAAGSFAAGDTVKVVVTPEYNSSKDAYSAPTQLKISTALDNSNLIGESDTKVIDPASSDDLYFDIVLTEGASTIYLARDGSICKQNPIVKSISVVRPVPVDHADVALVGVAIDGEALPDDFVTHLISEGSFTILTSYVNAPVVAFVKHTDTYYEGEAEPVSTNDSIKVTATDVDGQWQAQATIGESTYTINAAKAASFTVHYMDDETELGTENVAANGTVAEYAKYQKKNLATFVGWYQDVDLTIEAVLTAPITAETYLYAKFENKYAESINFEQWILDNSKGEESSTTLIGMLGAKNFATNLAYEEGNIEIDSLKSVAEKEDRNEPYLGLKVKKSGKMIDFRLAKNSYVNVKFGAIKNEKPQVSINGSNYEDVALVDGVYNYEATEEAYVSIKMVSNNAVVFKQIMIDEAVATVTLPSEGGETALGNTEAEVKAVKRIVNGQLLIEKNGVLYNAQGAVVK